MELQSFFCATDYLAVPLLFTKYYCGNQIKEDETKQVVRVR
jgi:hypothetical protein